MWLHDLKIFLEQYSGLEKDALHVHGALFLYFLALVLFRQTRRSRFPWLFVFALELGNEYMDYSRYDPGHGPYPWNESFKDLWNTMLWPTALLLIGRYTTLFERSSWKRPAPAAPEGEGPLNHDGKEGSASG